MNVFVLPRFRAPCPCQVPRSMATDVDTQARQLHVHALRDTFLLLIQDLLLGLLEVGMRYPHPSFPEGQQASLSAGSLDIRTGHLVLHVPKNFVLGPVNLCQASHAGSCRAVTVPCGGMMAGKGSRERSLRCLFLVAP